MNTFLVVKAIFSIYTILLFSRIALSWFPTVMKYEATKFLLAVTDPYMNIFRKMIPPINGIFDLSPLLALFSLRFIESFILRLLS
jgi:YggT family protein